MRQCTTCGRTYPNEVDECEYDGSPLFHIGDAVEEEPEVAQQPKASPFSSASSSLSPAALAAKEALAAHASQQASSSASSSSSSSSGFGSSSWNDASSKAPETRQSAMGGINASSMGSFGAAPSFGSDPIKSSGMGSLGAPGSGFGSSMGNLPPLRQSSMGAPPATPPSSPSMMGGAPAIPSGGPPSTPNLPPTPGGRSAAGSPPSRPPTSGKDKSDVDTLLSGIDAELDNFEEEQEPELSPVYDANFGASHPSSVGGAQSNSMSSMGSMMGAPGPAGPGPRPGSMAGSSMAGMHAGPPVSKPPMSGPPISTQSMPPANLSLNPNDLPPVVEQKSFADMAAEKKKGGSGMKIVMIIVVIAILIAIAALVYVLVLQK